MKSAVAKSRPGSEFDSFLFAALGEDRNGLAVSIVSHLARMNLDPWQEAETLAALPAEVAAKRLALSLDTLTDQNLRPGNSEVEVLRLLALLPPPAPTAQTRGMSAGAVSSADPEMRIGIAVFITFAIFLVGSQILAAHRDSAIQPGAVPVPSMLTAPSHTPPTPAAH